MFSLFLGLPLHRNLSPREGRGKERKLSSKNIQPPSLETAILGKALWPRGKVLPLPTPSSLAGAGSLSRWCSSLSKATVPFFVLLTQSPWVVVQEGASSAQLFPTDSPCTLTPGLPGPWAREPGSGQSSPLWASCRLLTSRHPLTVLLASLLLYLNENSPGQPGELGEGSP